MFLRKSLSNGKIYLSFVQGYRDENGKVKQKTIQKLGYLDDLKKIYNDPITHFKQIAKDKNNEEIINEILDSNLRSDYHNIDDKILDLHRKHDYYFEIKLIDNLLYLRFNTGTLFTPCASNPRQEATDIAIYFSLLNELN